jgi:hypothetical protein
MANELLDFVISLVRDPDAAARYAANPAQSIAAAQLTDVTSADVSNLIPMVTDSLSMPTLGGAGLGTAAPADGNVWASGAAAAALDSFTPQPAVDVGDRHLPPSTVIGEPSAPGPGQTPTDPPTPGVDSPTPSVLLTGVDAPQGVDDHGVFATDDPNAWDHSVIHPHAVTPDHHGFGLPG